MRKTLLATVAVAAVVGFTTMAAAQAPEGDKGTARPQGTEQPSKPAPGGAMTHQQGTQPTGKTPGSQGGQSAQDQGPGTGAKGQERMGQTQEKTQEKGVEPQNKTTSQRGTQEETGKSGAGKSGVTVDEKNAHQASTPRGGSAQLSQDQRTRIQAVVGKDHGARFNGNVNFNIAVGSAIPRSVSIEVLPSDVVEIVPQYEGFNYVVVGDEMLIVDPRTLEIVAILPV